LIPSRTRQDLIARLPKKEHLVRSLSIAFIKASLREAIITGQNLPMQHRARRASGKAPIGFSAAFA
jgi:hypothetical protein